jgi:hypothetical protein
LQSQIYERESDALKKSKEVKVISGVSFQPETHDLVALLWLFLYARVLQDDPTWRPEGWFDSNPYMAASDDLPVPAPPLIAVWL